LLAEFGGAPAEPKQVARDTGPTLNRDAKHYRATRVRIPWVDSSLYLAKCSLGPRTGPRKAVVIVRLGAFTWCFGAQAQRIDRGGA